ncbi:kinase-like domain-containing protein [Calycina marina]|uniref:Kinase-like domain-containing protein n=1 Tax=Calycina marina TaxID=1763456 RepID=A0A9P8CHC1_9HELO|nr:kinase-like domain-containing protein [Calycina marina]
MADVETQDLTQYENKNNEQQHQQSRGDFPEHCLATIEVEAIDGELACGHNIPIYAEQDVIVGREGDRCQIKISDPRVSKQHFRIYSIIYEANSTDFPVLIYCEDLESSNGTYINGRLIGKISQERIGVLLSDGDVIEIRPFWKFKFHQSKHQINPTAKGNFSDLVFFCDQYEISNRMLGKGQYGNVFLATEVATKKQLACKIINIELAMSSLSSQSSAATMPRSRWEEAQFQKKRVLLEIRILSKLSHPNIIDLKRAFCSRHYLYMFSELSSGGDLYSYMQAHGGSIDDYNSRFITKQVLEATQYLHSKGIVHRDIKPENILVSQTFFGGRAILTDFGFAINICARAGRLMSKLGTECYAAPEVQTVDFTSKGYTQAADLWSLGVLTAMMLVGDSSIPRQELIDLGHFDVVDRYVGDNAVMSEQELRSAWFQLPPRALSFIRKLLTHDADIRMTAGEALHHSWLTKPRREAEALSEGIEKVNKFWTMRDADEDILESLPGAEIPSAIVDTATGPRFRKRLPDVSMASPYFGLDRHIYSKEQSTRKQILEDLMNSGSQFLIQEKPIFQKTPASPKASSLTAKYVPANDLFGSLGEDPEQNQVIEGSDEAELLPTTLVENVYGFNATHNSCHTVTQTPRPDVYDIPKSPKFSSRIKPHLKTRVRVKKFLASKKYRLSRQSQNSDAGAADHPQYTSAQAQRDGISKVT